MVCPTDAVPHGFSVSSARHICDVVQVVVSAGRSNAALWDAQSGVFLGTIASFGSPMDNANLIDPTTGWALDPLTQRALRGATAPMPPLGTMPVDHDSGSEEQRMRRQLGNAASTAHSVASNITKKYAPVPPLQSRTINFCLRTVLGSAALT